MSSLRPSRNLIDVRLVLVVAAVSLAIGISVAVTVSQSYGQVSGTPGSPGATTTIGGEQLPPPPSTFGGTIERTTEGLPFAFSGRIERITLSIDRPQLSPADIQKLQHAQRSKRTTE